jgi:hypothetical protein
MDDDFENEFRHDVYLQRALKQKKRKGTGKQTRVSVRPFSNAEEPIEITHVSLPKRGKIIPFLYHFPCPRQGYADLYFVAPDLLIDFWLIKYDRSFYEAPSPELKALLARREFYPLTSPISAWHGDTLVRKGVELSLRSGTNRRSLGHFEDLLASMI